MEVVYGGRGTPLSAIRPCRMSVTLSMALNTCKSLHFTILELD